MKKLGAILRVSQALRIFYLSRRAPHSVSTCLAVLLIAGLFSVGSQAAETGPRTFVDDLDRKVTLSKTPRRIVSLAPSN